MSQDLRNKYSKVFSMDLCWGLKQPRRAPQQKREKQLVFVSKTSALQVHHNFL